MFKELDEPTNLLDEAQLDLTIHRLKYRVWQSDERVWQVWIRT